MSQRDSEMGGKIHQNREVRIHLLISFIYRNLCPKSIIIEGKREQS